MARRAIDVGLTLVWAQANGLSAIWGSLTSWHNEDSDLKGLLDVQKKAWRRVVQSRAWTDEAAKKGGMRVGYLRAAELNVGPNGWHPHFHPLILVKVSNWGAAVEHARFIQDGWISAVNALGGYAGDGGAQQLRVLSPDDVYGRGLDGYLTKSRYSVEKLSMELLWSQNKTGNGRPRETVTHWSLLDAAGQGLADPALMWWELEAATHGHRMLTWSRGLRDLVGLGEETSDAMEAARELGSKEDTVCYISPAGWRIVRERPALQSGILDVLEQDGWVGLRSYLDRHGVEWALGDELVPEGDPFGVRQTVQKLDKLSDSKGGYRRAYIDPELFGPLLKLGQ